MSIKMIFLSLVVCLFCISCASNRIGHESYSHDSAHDKGVRYLLGHGVPQDDKKAFYWFNKAARSEDDPFAENQLAYMYIAGEGVERDDEQALFWYQKAAGHGLASAQYNLGLMYLNGIGTTPNKDLGLQWLKKSASNGFEPATIALKKQSS